MYFRLRTLRPSLLAFSTTSSRTPAPVLRKSKSYLARVLLSTLTCYPKIRLSPSANENANTMRSCLMHQKPCRSQNLRICTTIFLGALAPLDYRRQLGMRGGWLPNSSCFSRAGADGQLLGASSNSFQTSNRASLGGC